jgi:PAS domain S-box-containing protein
MRLTTAQKITAGFVAAALILIVGAFSWRSTRQTFAAASWVAHTHEVLTSLENVLSDLVDTETGARGYLLTGDARFLEPYEHGTRALPAHLDATRRLTADNPAQQQRLQALGHAIAAKLAFVQRVIGVRRADLSDSASRMVAMGEGKTLMDEVRRQVDVLEREEQRLLDVRTTERRNRETATSAVIVTGSVLAFALVTLMIGFIRRDIRLQQRTAAERDPLLERVSAANAQLSSTQRVTDVALGPLSLDDLLDELMQRVRTELRVDAACVLLITRDGEQLELCKCVGVTEEIHDRVRVPLGEGVEGEIAAQARSICVPDIAGARVFDPVVRANFASMLGAPLVVPDRGHASPTGSVTSPNAPGMRVIGVVHVLSVAPRTFTPDEEQLLTLVAERAASAIERGRLHQAERRTEERFRLLLDNVRDYALFMLDDAGNVSSWNVGAERLFGHTAAEIIGQPVSRLHDAAEAHGDMLANMLQRARAEGNVRHEGWRIRADGTRFWADTVLTALHDEDDGRLVGFAKVTRDLTEQRRIDEALVAAKEEAEAASAAKSQFLATMSHEIRTPINAVLGYTQLLEMGLSGPVTAEQRAKLGRIDASARHLLGLVNELLDLAKIEADQLRVDPVTASVREAADDAISLVFPQANARGLSLTSTCDGDNVTYHGDPHRVEQVLVNLLSNAVKFTPNGGRIELSCGYADGSSAVASLPAFVPRWCFVRVSDTGIGIPEDQLTSIFDPFTQATRPGRSPTSTPAPTERRSAYSREHGGTGLGLTISRRLARLMGGDVTVESVPGEGTTFTLWLPASFTVKEGDGASASAERRTGSRDARGLAIVGRTLRDRAAAVLRTHVHRLRTDFGAPNAPRLSDIDLEDHLDTVLTELALSLTTIDHAAGHSTIQLRDGSAIQKVLAQRHGGQRASLGWREEEVVREMRLLQSEIEAEVRSALDGDADVDLNAAFGVLAHRLEHMERFSAEGWRKRMVPDMPADPATT